MTAAPLTLVTDDALPPASPPAGPGDWFKCTDLGNAERFAARHGHDVRYIPAWKAWFEWDGRVWRQDKTGGVMRRAKATVRAIMDDANRMRDDKPDRASDLVKWSMKSEGEPRLRAMLNLATAERGISIVPDQLDADPWLLAVENGTIDLRTGVLREHRRGDLITKCVPAAFDPTAGCPMWLRFLDRVLAGDAELLAFLQRAIGYSLTGMTNEQCLLFLYGHGANGKSTFLEVLRALLAGYATQADFTTFLEKQGDGPRNDVARLFGARVVTSSEVGEGKRLNESLVKALTGDEVIAARFLYAEAFEFKPTFKLWLAANHRPVVRGTDHAIWRRMRLVPFTVQIPEHERDEGLRAKLFAELPGILAWAVQGCQLWLEQGLGTAERVEEATTQYREDSDTIGQFIDECCELGSPALYAVPATELFQAYVAWAAQGKEYQLSQTTFGRRLEERGLTAEKRGRGDKRVKWRLGIKLVHAPPRVPAGAAAREEELWS